MNSSKNIANTKHLDYFRHECLKIVTDPNTRDGHDILLFSRDLPHIETDLLANFIANDSRKLTRNEVKQICNANSKFSIRTAIFAIMAWGGMRWDHRLRVFADGNPLWLQTASNIREGKLTRVEAYAELSKLYLTKDLPCMGPAFFTKLIHFLMPNTTKDQPIGLIMDQWAACSINLLWDDKNLVLCDTATVWTARLTKKTEFIVSKYNTSKNYEEFCSAVENLDKLCGNVGLDLIDFTLQAKKNPWRHYVLNNR